MQIESEVIFMKFGHEILKYRDDILRDLAKLIAVPSVCTHPLPGKPFGEAPAQAPGMHSFHGKEHGI